MIGIGLAIIQQVTGINAIIYYANDIFARAGFATAEDQAQATLYAIGLVNVLSTFIAIAYVDRFGRRPLLLAGLVGMTASLAAVGASFAFFSTESGGGAEGISVAGVFTLVALVVFIASFAFSLGPVVWTVISEIYPNRVRGRAVSLATAVNWGAAFLITPVLPDASSTRSARRPPSSSSRRPASCRTSGYAATFPRREGVLSRRSRTCGTPRRHARRRRPPRTPRSTSRHASGRRGGRWW